MRYRHTSVYEMAKNNNDISLNKLEELINQLIPSCQDNTDDISKMKEDSLAEQNKLRRLEELVNMHSEEIERFKEEKEELIQLIEQKINNLSPSDDKGAELLLDELLLFKNEQQKFNIEIIEKVDNRIDRINELIDFINSIKDRIDELESKISIKEIVEEKNTDTTIDDVVENVIENNSNSDLENEIQNLKAKILEEQEENKKLIKLLNENKNPEDDLSYNESWLKEFEEMKLSLEDDGIYEYEYDEIGDEEMKFDFYNGELPKTKIVKVRSNELVKSYDHDEINSFIGEEARKLASREIDKLQQDSEMTQKAWLANNQKLTQMASIIEKQEQEIKRLNAENRLKDFDSDNFSEDLSKIIKHEALKLIRDEYEERILNLEHGKSTKPSSLEELEKELRLQKAENERLRTLLGEKPQEPQKVVVEVKAEEPKIVVNKNPEIAISQKKKRKQKFFFEIKEHNSPKITKADLERQK